MPKHGKKYVEASKLVDSTALYEVEDALALLDSAESDLLNRK